MAGYPSSVGTNLSKCSSNPHRPATTVEDDRRMQMERLAGVTRHSGNEHFAERLVSGAKIPSDHVKTLTATIASLTAQLNVPSTTDNN
ncbi:hypothetical protein F4804DRAFT_336128 [Jackrogersella minutella]|nr:hypothetical protein F4804DRAFT_336128 [Jackrogersella minutella]